MLRRLPHRLTLLRTGTVTATATPSGILVESSTGCKLGFHSGHNLFSHPFGDLTTAEHRRRTGTALEVGACSSTADGSRRYLRTGQFLVGSEIKQINTTNNNGVSPADKLWRSKYDLLVAYLKKKDGASEYLYSSMSQRNPSLHRWVERQRINYRAELKLRQKGDNQIQPVRSMPQERIGLLNKIQFDWGSMPEDQNEDTYDSHLIEWVSKGGDKMMLPKELPTNKIKPSKKDTAINPKKVVKTENPVTKEIPTEPQPSKRNKDKRKEKTKRSVASLLKKWNDNFAQLVEFKKVTGHTDVPTLEGPLGKWVYYQRQNNLKEGKLSKRRQEQVTKLESIGFSFELEPSDESMVSALMPVPKDRSYEDLRTWDMEGPSLATKNHPPLHRWIMMERSKFKDSETKQKPQKTKAKKKGAIHLTRRKRQMRYRGKELLRRRSQSERIPPGRR
eukprot:scaffold41710_cov55-Attheya_sp.AAC.1